MCIYFPMWCWEIQWLHLGRNFHFYHLMRTLNQTLSSTWLHIFSPGIQWGNILIPYWFWSLLALCLAFYFEFPFWFELILIWALGSFMLYICFIASVILATVLWSVLKSRDCSILSCSFAIMWTLTQYFMLFRDSDPCGYVIPNDSLWCYTNSLIQVSIDTQVVDMCLFCLGKVRIFIHAFLTLY